MIAGGVVVLQVKLLMAFPKTALAVEVPVTAMAAQSGIFVADAAPG